MIPTLLIFVGLLILVLIKYGTRVYRKVQLADVAVKAAVRASKPASQLVVVGYFDGQPTNLQRMNIEEAVKAGQLPTWAVNYRNDYSSLRDELRRQRDTLN